LLFLQQGSIFPFSIKTLVVTPQKIQTTRNTVDKEFMERELGKKSIKIEFHTITKGAWGSN
jgi:hypothetical protein